MTNPIHFSPTREQEIPAEAQVNPKTKKKYLKDLPEDSPYFYSAHLIVEYDNDSRERLEVFRENYPDIIKDFSLGPNIRDRQNRKTAGKAQTMSMLHMKIINAHSKEGKVFELPNDDASEKDIQKCETAVHIYPIEEKNKEELRDISVSLPILGRNKYDSTLSQLRKYRNSAEKNGTRSIRRKTAIKFNNTLANCTTSKKAEDVFHRLEKFKTGLNEPIPTADKYAELGLSSKTSSTAKKRRRCSDDESEETGEDCQKAKRIRPDNTHNSAFNNASNNTNNPSNNDEFISSESDGMQNPPEPPSNATPQTDRKGNAHHFKASIPEESPYFYSTHTIVKLDNDSSKIIEGFKKDYPEILRDYDMVKKTTDCVRRGKMPLINMKIIDHFNTEEKLTIVESSVALYPLVETNKADLMKREIPDMDSETTTAQEFTTAKNQFIRLRGKNNSSAIHRDTAIRLEHILFNGEDVFKKTELFNYAMNEPVPTADEYKKLGLSSKTSTTNRQREQDLDDAVISDGDESIRSENENDSDYAPEEARTETPSQSQRPRTTRQQAKNSTQLSSPSSEMTYYSPQPPANLEFPDVLDTAMANTQAPSPSSGMQNSPQSQPPSNATPPSAPDPIDPEWEELWQLSPSSPAEDNSLVDNGPIANSNNELPISDTTHDHFIFFEPGFARGQAAAGSQWG